MLDLLLKQVNFEYSEFPNFENSDSKLRTLLNFEMQTVIICFFIKTITKKSLCFTISM